MALMFCPSNNIALFHRKNTREFNQPTNWGTSKWVKMFEVLFFSLSSSCYVAVFVLLNKNEELKKELQDKAAEGLELWEDAKRCRYGEMGIFGEESFLPTCFGWMNH